MIELPCELIDTLIVLAFWLAFLLCLGMWVFRRDRP
jgi:lipopolysaccharide export LptBFGC system permease protein LptF